MADEIARRRPTPSRLVSIALARCPHYEMALVPGLKPLLFRKEHQMSYCPFLQTLHDDTRPVGNLGRGTHYSVLRAPVWHDELLNRLDRCAFLDFAVIWDEDHDDRVIDAIMMFYVAGLLSPHPVHWGKMRHSVSDSRARHRPSLGAGKAGSVSRRDRRHLPMPRGSVFSALRRRRWSTALDHP